MYLPQTLPPGFNSKPILEAPPPSQKWLVDDERDAYLDTGQSGGFGGGDARESQVWQLSQKKGEEEDEEENEAPA